MSDDLISYPLHADTMSQLESIKKTTSNGREYWLAREIHPVLGYEEWRNFQYVIGRAISACEGNGLDPKKHFVETNKMARLGKDGSEAKREVTDYFLSRPACYLIAMNGDPSKAQIAAAQAYFAIQTRRMELEDQKSEDQKRLELREKVTQSHKRVSGVAKGAGVRNRKQGVFHDARYRGLYRKPTAIVKRDKGLKENDNLFDYAGPLELSAHNFQMNLAADVIDTQRVKGEQAAIDKNLEVGRKVRDTIEKSGATLPEDLKLSEPIATLRKRIAGKTKNLSKPSSAS